MSRSDTQPRRSPLRSIALRLVPGLLVGIGASLLVTLLQLAVPVYSLQVFTRVLTSRSIETLVLLTVIVIGAIIAYRLLSGLRQMLHLRLGEWFGIRLNQDILAVLVRKTLGNQADAGMALKDVSDLTTFVSGRSFTTLFDFLWSPLFLIVLAILHPLFALVAAVGALLMVALGVLNEVIIHRAQQDSTERGVRANGRLTAALRNAEAIEAMGMLSALASRWQRESGEARQTHLAVMRRSIAINTASTAVRLIVQIALIATAAYLVIRQEVTPGALMAVMILSNNMLAPFGALIDGWSQWVTAFGAYRRLDRMLSDEVRRSTMALPTPEGGVVVDRLVFVPPGTSRAVLQGITFSVEEGESVCVLGPSASGKSTLMRLLVGVWAPTAGSVRLGGHDVHTWSRDDFGRHVGYLPQDVELFAGTVRENIARMQAGDPSAVVAAAKAAGIHGLIGTLPNGYDTDIGPGGHPLTGGQRQRIGLARALYGRPRLLVLDEPDASLDSDGLAALRDAIVAARNDGAVVFVVTHRNMLLSVFDKALVLKEGRVAHFGDRTTVIRPVEALTAATPSGAIAGSTPPALEHGHG